MEQKIDFNLILPAIIVGFVALLLNVTALKTEEYKNQADEGAYLNQASVVLQNGFFSGIKILGKQYLTNANNHNTPAPTRIAHTLYTLPFLYLEPSFQALSFASGLAFVLVLLFGFWALKRLFSLKIALVWLALCATSPLYLSMARRALMDADQTAFMFVLIVYFALCLKDFTPKKYYIFLVLASIAPLYKETNLLLLPIFIAILVYAKHKKLAAISWLNILLLPIFCCCAYLACLYFVFDGWAGVQGFFAIYKTALAPTPDLISYGVGAYNHQFGSGKWVAYILDYFMLSPLVVGLFFVAIGSFWADGNLKNNKIRYFLGFVIGIFFVYNLTTKNVRYVLILEPLMRIVVAIFIVHMWETAKKTTTALRIFAVAVAVLLFMDLWQFRFYFLTQKIYDPISYNLLQAEKIIPAYAPAAVTASYTLPQTYDDYINLSLQFYNQKNYKGCIATCTQALSLNPAAAEAYNNMGAAYNNMGEYPNAIAVLEQAIKLNPSNQLATSNLAYAKSMLK